MDPDRKDEEALEREEEERMAKQLQNVKLHGKNAYAATHSVPPKKNSVPQLNGSVSPRSQQPSGSTSPRGEQSSGTVSPRGTVTVGARGPRIHKKEPSGPLPEWKRAQLEREEAEKKRVEEEERRRRQYQEQIVQSASSGHSLIDTSSAMSGGTFVDPAKKVESPVKEPDTVVPGKAIFDDKDKEEELRKEEEYLMRRTGSLVVKKKPAHHIPESSLTGDHNRDAHLALSPKSQKVTVAWVDAVSGDTIQELPFFVNGGRLPMAAIEGAFGIRNVVWKETKQALTAGPDGFSSVSLGNRNVIEIIADRK